MRRCGEVAVRRVYPVMPQRCLFLIHSPDATPRYVDIYDIHADMFIYVSPPAILLMFCLS